jgi:hypothetical protein
MTIFGFWPNCPETETDGLELLDDDPHPARARAASSGTESAAAMRRMVNLVISGSELRQPTGIT